MKILNAEETMRCMPYVEVVRELERILLLPNGMTAYTPERHVLTLPNGGSLLVMPASDRDYAIVKLVTVHINNDSNIRPIVQGDVIVIRASDGERLLLLDGAVLTSIRTASLSILALQRLAKHPSGPVLMIGSGVQAKSHLVAMRETFGIEHAYLSSRNRDTAKFLIRELMRIGLRVEWIDEPLSVVDEVRVVVSCTDSLIPVVPEYLQPETMVVAVGAFKPTMCEIPKLLIERASKSESMLVVDTIDGAKSEAGDLLQANVSWSCVRSLGECLQVPKQASDITLFKSVGSSLWDLAACRVAVSKSC